MADPNYNIFGQRHNPNEWRINFNRIRDRLQRNQRVGLYRRLTLEEQVRMAIFALPIGYEATRYLVTSGFSQLMDFITSNNDEYTTPEKADVPEPTMSPDNRPITYGIDPNDSVFGDQTDESFQTARTSSFSNSPSKTKMASNDSLVKLSATGSDDKKGSHETPVNYKIPPQIKLIQDTHTVILPVRFYVSGVTKFNEALDLRILTNSLSSIFPTFGHVNAPANVTINTKLVGSPFTKGWYRQKIPCSSKLVGTSDFPSTLTRSSHDPNEYEPFEEPSLSRWTQTKYHFPFEMTSADINGIVAENRAWWYKTYNYYHVMKMDYEIQIENCCLREGGDIIMGKGLNSWSATRTNDIYPLSSQFTDARAWPGLSFETIRSTGDRDSGDRFHVISGTVKNGDAKRLVNNDEDVTTWTQVSTGIPTLREDIHFMFWPSPFNTVTGAKGLKGNTANAQTNEQYTNTAQTVFNMAVTLKYYAQFKDPFPKLRYKKRLDTATDDETWKIPTDQNQTASAPFTENVS